MLILASLAVRLLSPGRANAILTYNIDQSDGDVIIQPNGALNRPTLSLQKEVAVLVHPHFFKTPWCALAGVMYVTPS